MCAHQLRGAVLHVLRGGDAGAGVGEVLRGALALGHLVGHLHGLAGVGDHGQRLDVELTLLVVDVNVKRVVREYRRQRDVGSRAVGGERQPGGEDDVSGCGLGGLEGLDTGGGGGGGAEAAAV